MGFRQESPPEARWRERRRGVRLNSSVRIAVEWETSDGGQISQEANTRVVSPYGCLVVLNHDLPLEKRLQVTNLDRAQTVQAMVVWKGLRRAEGWEHGIELQNPEMDFWGLEL